MIRFLFSIFLLLSVFHASVWAQSNGDFNPTLPEEPGMMSKVNVSVSPEGAGSAYGSGMYAIGEHAYLYTYPAGDQWRFKRWVNKTTGKEVSRDSHIYFTTVYGTSSLVAEYDELEVSGLVLECNPSEASASLYGSGNYVEGTDVYVYCYSPSAFVFKNWTNKRTGDVVSYDSYVYFNKSACADTLVANFEFSPGTPAEPEPAIVYRHVYADVNMSVGGSISSSDQRIEVGKKATVSAYNNTNFEFVGWQQDGKIVSTKTSYTVTMGKSDISLIAVFQFAPNRPDEPEMTEKQPEEEPDEPDPDNPEEPEPEEPQGPSTVLGDANGDYMVNNEDVDAMNEYRSTRVEPEGFIFKNADITRDGRIDLVDVIHVKAYIKLKEWSKAVKDLWEDIFHW